MRAGHGRFRDIFLTCECASCTGCFLSHRKSGGISYETKNRIRLPGDPGSLILSSEICLLIFMTADPELSSALNAFPFMFLRIPVSDQNLS